MKILTFLVTAFLTFSVFAGPDDNPLVPWPTGILPRKLLTEDIQGHWFGFGNNTLWLVKIVPNKIFRYEQVMVDISSNGLSHGAIHSPALKKDNIFWGVVNTKTPHPVGFAIFREGKYIVMRISQGGTYIEEMQLFRRGL